MQRSGRHHHGFRARGGRRLSAERDAGDRHRQSALRAGRRGGSGSVEAAAARGDGSRADCPASLGSWVSGAARGRGVHEDESPRHRRVASKPSTGRPRTGGSRARAVMERDHRAAAAVRTDPDREHWPHPCDHFWVARPVSHRPRGTAYDSLLPSGGRLQPLQTFLFSGRRPRIPPTPARFAAGATSAADATPRVRPAGRAAAAAGGRLARSTLRPAWRLWPGAAAGTPSGASTRSSRTLRRSVAGYCPHTAATR